MFSLFVYSASLVTQTSISLHYWNWQMFVIFHKLIHYNLQDGGYLVMWSVFQPPVYVTHTNIIHARANATSTERVLMVLLILAFNRIISFIELFTYLNNYLQTKGDRITKDTINYHLHKCARFLNKKLYNTAYAFDWLSERLK